MTWQPAGLLFPDIEAHLAATLPALLEANFPDEVHVGRRIPKKRKDAMVIVNRDGGAVGEVRDRPRVRFRAWHIDDEKANDLAAFVVACVPLLVGNGTVLRVEHLSGPYDVTDSSGQPQRYVLFEIHTRPERELTR